MHRFIIVTLMLAVFVITVPSKSMSDQHLSDRALAQYISSKIDSALDDRVKQNTTYCDKQGCVVVVQ